MDGLEMLAWLNGILGLINALMLYQSWRRWNFWFRMWILAVIFMCSFNFFQGVIYG